MMLQIKKTQLSRTMTQQLIITAILFVLMFILSLMSDRFLTSSNMITVLRQATLVMVVGAGATILMIASHMDLSTGSALAFGGVLYSKLACTGMSLLLAAFLCLCAGALIGFINGFLVTRLRITHFIATMGTMYAVRGLAYIACGGTTIYSGFPRNFDRLGRGVLFGVIPYMVVIAIIAIAVFIFIQRKTVLGKYSYAIGDNRVAAGLSGINVDGIVLLNFVIVAVLASFCGIMMSSRLGAGDPNVGTTFHFDVICAIVLGGTSIKGGEGSIIGMATGALIIEFLNNGLNIMGVQTFWQDVLKGVVLVLAVVLTRALNNHFKKMAGNQ